jgi:hypothetical protein
LVYWYYIFEKDIMEYKHRVDWDYNNPDETLLSRRDYNKTLITKINYISNLIHRGSFRGGADTIIIHPSIEELFYNEWYYEGTKQLIGRYQVVLDDSMPRNIIKLENKKVLGNLVVIPRLLEEGNPAGDPLFPTINMFHIYSCSQDEIDSYIGELGGYIDIINLR